MKDDIKNSTKGKAATFSAEERAAMRERAKEQKAEAGKVEGESAVLAKIAEMSRSDRAMAKRLHEIIKANAPNLTPKLWYGMPAYAKTARWSASSKARRSSKRGMEPLAFPTPPTWTAVACGRLPSASVS